MEKKEGIKKSIKKWEEVQLILEKAELLDYQYKYWRGCGYCKINNSCSACSLENGRFKGILYCSSSDISVAYIALLRGDERKFKVAIKYVKALLKKMREDLEEVEDDGMEM